MDSGDYTRCLDETLRLAGYDELLKKRDAARAEGRLYGLGFAVGVEPSGSNMAYVTLAQTAEERAKGEPKSGGNASAIISMDPSGSVTVQLCSTPNGQGHATVTAQIVAEALGLDPGEVDVVTEIDTQTSAWSIASGNYANRFAAAVTSSVRFCSEKVATKLRKMAAERLECDPADIELKDGAARIVGVPDKAIPVRKLAAAAHWNPAGMPEDSEPGIYESAVFSPPTLTSADDQDRVPSSVTYGAVFDLVAVEVDKATGHVHVDKYISVHDVGNMLNPQIVEGQVWGGYVHGLGAAMLEEIAYDAHGNLLSGTFADYLCPTAPEIPPLTIGHANTPSPFTALGCKGLGDGSSMLTPAALANAVSDAVGLREVELPLTLHRVWQMAQGTKPAPSFGFASTEPAVAGTLSGAGLLTGEGETIVATDRQTVWNMLLDPDSLARIIPGCETLERTGEDAYRAVVTIGVAGIRGRYDATVALHDKEAPGQLRLTGSASGALGHGEAEGQIALSDAGDERTRLTYSYKAKVGGKVASVGQRMLGAATKILIGQVFDGLNRQVGGKTQGPIGKFIATVKAFAGGRP